MVMEKGNTVYLTLESASYDDQDMLITDGVICVMALYYIYQFEYPSCSTSCFYFLQQFVLLESEIQRSHSSYESALSTYLAFVNRNY